jgi:hypothetical protein
MKVRAGTAIARCQTLNNLRLLASLCVALGSGALVAGCTTDTTTGPGSTDAALAVHNESDFAIVELHVTQVGNSDWGPNLLGGSALRPGDSISLAVNCDTYDALLVDDSGVDCQLHSVQLCFSSSDWVIQNNTCAVFATAKAARDAAAATAGSAATTR